MNPSPNEHELTAREVYCRAVEEPDDQKREQLIEKLCSGRPEIDQRVKQLLDARTDAEDGLLARVVDAWKTDETDKELESPSGTTPENVGEPAEYDTLLRSNDSKLTGQHFGPYQLLEVLGEGGMGTVYRAKQTSPLEREVALKVIKSESHTKQAIARFARERKAMALMQHPNIASVYDGGETADGCQYLVMELVLGVPIDQYCRDNALNLEQTLALFRDLGRAIQHAHGKNIIHRDLKPSNILVTTVDNIPMVKVIDFGIAKSIRVHLELELEQTRTGHMLGTPLYQSPEQLDGSESSTGVHSDVYALGVVLYKLLTGTTPIDRGVMVQAGYEGLMRKLKEQDYETPSVRAQKLAGEKTGLPKSSFASLSKNRQADLDWIVLKSLHPDPNGRYGTTEEMLDDLAKFLKREPVSAGPLRRMGPLRKWGRHQHIAMTIAVAILAVLASGIYLFVTNNDSTGKRIAESPEIAPATAEATAAETPDTTDAAVWRKTAQLQLGLSAFREADYSAVFETFATSATLSQDVASGAKGSGSNFSLSQMLYRAAYPKPEIELSDSADIQSAAFSPKSQRLVVATNTGEVRLYSTKDGGLARTPDVIGTQPGRVDAIAISPDGRRAVTGTDALWFWDLDAGKLLHKGVWLDAGIESIVWSPDGKVVAAGGRYACVWVGDPDGKEFFRVPNDHRHEDLVFTADSNSVLIPTRDGIDEYQVPSGKRLRTIAVKPLVNIRTMTIAGEAQQYLIAADRFEETALVIDLQNGKPVGSLPLDGSYPQCFRSTGNGKWLAALYPDGKCSMMRIAIDKQGANIRKKLVFQFSSARQVDDKDRIDLLWIKPLQKFLTIGGSSESKLWDWDGIDPVLVKNPPMQLWDVVPAVSDDIVFFPAEPGDLENRAFYVPLSGRSDQMLGDKLTEPAGIFSRSSRRQTVASLGDKMLEMIDLKAGGKLIAQMECIDLLGQRRISLSRDGHTVGVGNHERVRVWATRDHWKTWDFHEFSDLTPDILLHVADDGSSFFTNEKSLLREVDISTGKTLKLYDDLQPGAPWKVEIDKRAGRVIIGKRDTLAVLDRGSGELLHLFHVDSEVTCILRISDTSNLITGHRDGTIRAWQLQTMQPLGILFQPTSRIGKISRLEEFPDCNRILAVARTGELVSPIIIGN